MFGQLLNRDELEAELNAMVGEEEAIGAPIIPDAPTGKIEVAKPV